MILRPADASGGILPAPSAFSGDTAVTRVDAKNCAFIGAGAFEDCRNLSEIRLPGNCEIAGDAFTGCGTVYVFAPAGGTTQTFCDSRPYLIFVPVPANADPQ